MTSVIPTVSCPCCGYLTVPQGTTENYNSHGFICYVCFWEIDTFNINEDDKSDSNHGLTLAQARVNFKKYGAMQKRLVKNCCKPTEDEIPLK